MTEFDSIGFRDLMKNDLLCVKLVDSICNSLSIKSNPQRIYEGSRILFEICGEKIVKIFSPVEREFCVNEAKYLNQLKGRLNVDTPGLVAEGLHHGYPFIVMEKLAGIPLKSIWSSRSVWEKKRILTQIADLLKELHSLPLSLMNSTESEWISFIKSRTDNLHKNHSEFGLDKTWTDKFSAFIEKTEPVEFSSKTVLCHTEIMKEHLFVEKRRSGYEIRGIIDFEPSMAAIPEYDFCSVGLFISRGGKDLFQHFLDSYGYTGDSSSVMRMLLLHRYSNMKWFISTIPQSINTNNVEDLCNYWF